MNWAVLALASIIHFATYYVYAAEYFILGYILEDVQILLLSLFGHMICPYYKFRLKTLSAVVFGFSSTAFIHNLFVYFGFWNGDLYPFASQLIQMILSVLIGLLLVTRFDKLKNYKVVKGNYYEIIGRPKSAFQYFAFFLTLGKSGSYAITDGVSLFKFCKDTGKMEELEYSVSYINGKKCLPIDVNIDKIRAKVGSDWSLINNCVTMRF